jgi:hypothetical protein
LHVLYDCSELPKARRFVSAIMKMDGYVLKSPHLRWNKYNDYTDNALHVRSIIICSDRLGLDVDTILHEYFRVLCDFAVCKNLSNVQTFFLV